MKQKKKIARLHAHIARQRKDYLHKESRKITNFYDLVCIESLNMKEMSQDSRFGKSVHDNGWGMFTDFLSYKLERAGKKWFVSISGTPVQKSAAAAENSKRSETGRPYV